jgi:hypothetical protein
MKKAEICLSAVLLITVAFGKPEPARADIDSLEVVIDAGLRQDRLHWNIAGISPLTFEPVDIMSELSWKEMEIYQTGGSARLVMGSSAVEYLTIIKGYFNYGWISEGSGRDSDYSGSNRTLEFSRSVSSTENGNVLDASIGLGFLQRFHQNRYSVALLGGYSFHEQNLKLTDGIQVISNDSLVSPDANFGPVPLGPFRNLDSTYDATWRGPWFGLDFEARPTEAFSLSGSAEYHWAVFRAEADWNLRRDFAHPVSFRHYADHADGLVLSVAGSYLLAANWALKLTLGYQRWQARNGLDRTFFADGSIGDTRLNEVKWQSSSGNAGISYIF